MTSSGPLQKLSLSRGGVLRERGDGREAPVTNMELFFDLVYVLTIIQLSEHLYEHLTLVGGLQTLVMFSAVWWSWNYTAWATGWIDPDKGRVVSLMAVLMILGIISAAVIPAAFTKHGQTFAESYVAMQVIRSAFMVRAFGSDEVMRRNYLQLLAWTVLSGLVWIAGGLVHDQNARLVVWGAAAVIDVGAPMHGFWLPGRGSTPMSDWSVAGGHLAERCQLVLMIAFGETVLRLGESYAQTRATDWVNVALVSGFILSAALWSIYFLHHGLAGAEKIERASAEEVGTMGRSAYAYAHMAMVGAVVVIAVTIHMAIEAPTRPVDFGFALICVGGPALYLVGLTLSKRWLGDGQLTHGPGGVLALVILGAAASFSDRVVEMLAATLVAVVLALRSQLEHYAERS